jgi:hypothetical protein
VASEGLQSGKLRRVLADWQLSAVWLSALYASTQRGALKLRLFIETLAAAYSRGAPPWDRRLIEAGVLAGELVE